MSTTTLIQVQAQDFDIAWHYAKLRTYGGGAVCLFTGLVRDLPEGGLRALYIEHFPKMAERALHAIAQEALQRWNLHGIHVVHRFGSLAMGEQIVLAACASDHRDVAFSSCCYIMDYVKTAAPFWKKSLAAQGDTWVKATEKDRQQIQRW